MPFSVGSSSFVPWLFQVTEVQEEPFCLLTGQGKHLSLHFKKSSLRQIKAAKLATEGFLKKKIVFMKYLLKQPL